MSKQDIVAERRFRRYVCDGCDVAESHFYDFAPNRWAHNDGEWEHRWQELTIAGQELSFCSVECLTKRLDGIKAWMYPTPTERVP